MNLILILSHPVSIKGRESNVGDLVNLKKKYTQLQYLFAFGHLQIYFSNFVW